jgi:arginine-tRNA-protein transferase
MAQSLDPALYHDLMNAGFRRSGQLVYQPICPTCRACVPLRVPVDRFTPGKSQRRVWRCNQDLRVEVALPMPTEEKLALYQRYLTRHNDDQSADAESFIDFLYTSPVDTLEFTYRDPAQNDALLAVGICDISPSAGSLSSVYFYFDPQHARRSLGTFGALWEIQFARTRSIPYYYLGYWIAGCGTMDYKANFRPHQLLGPDGAWHDFLS